MPTKLIQAAAITFVLYLVIGMKPTDTSQNSWVVVDPTAPTQLPLSREVAELIALYQQR